MKARFGPQLAPSPTLQWPCCALATSEHLGAREPGPGSPIAPPSSALLACEGASLHGFPGGRQKLPAMQKHTSGLQGGPAKRPEGLLRLFLIFQDGIFFSAQALFTLLEKSALNSASMSWTRAERVLCKLQGLGCFCHGRLAGAGVVVPRPLWPLSRS